MARPPLTVPFGRDVNASFQFGNDTRVSISVTYAFFFLQIFGGQIGIPIILVTLLVSAVRRHPLVVNFLVTWVVWSISFCLLLYTGYQYNYNTPHTLCVIQYALIQGVTVMASISLFALIYNLWSSTRRNKLADEDDELALPQKRSPLDVRILLAAPYIGFLICGSIVFFVPESATTAIFRDDGSLYCTTRSTYTRIFPLIGSSIVVVALIFQSIVIVKLCQTYKSFNGLGLQKDLSLPVVVRFALVSLGSFLALSAMWVSVLTDRSMPSAHILQGFLPTLAFLVFGTQTDLLEVWGLVSLWAKLRAFVRRMSGDPSNRCSTKEQVC